MVTPPHQDHPPPLPPPNPFPKHSQIAYALATLTAGGGITGYVRTGSVPSVIAGCSVGALYALGGYRMQNRQSYGLELALLASVVLAGSSVPRALRSRKPLPMGLSALAVFGLFKFGVGWANGYGTVKVD
ncbi:hypothetical protein MBLNU230_g4988t1 [Neophaeotheca triangularis]